MFGFKIYNCRTGQASLIGAGFVRMWPASQDRRGGLHAVAGQLPCALFRSGLQRFSFSPMPLYAHELWIMTPEQIIEFNSKPKPDLYTHWSANNITMIMLFLLLMVRWVRLNYTGAREFVPPICKPGLLPMEIMFHQFCDSA